MRLGKWVGLLGGWVCVLVSYTSLTHTLKRRCATLHGSMCTCCFVFSSQILPCPSTAAHSNEVVPVATVSFVQFVPCLRLVHNERFFFLFFERETTRKQTTIKEETIPRSEKGIGWDRQRLSPSLHSLLVIIIVITEKYLKKKVDQLRISSAHSVGVF